MPKLLTMLLCIVVAVSGCGGGENTSVTTVSGAGLQGAGVGPEVAYDFQQKINNIPVVIDNGPADIFSMPQANVLYATVRVCEPGSDKCMDIDHVQVDTGSVGLRILASKVKQLNLPAVELSSTGGSVRKMQSHECYPFVIGGLWGPNKVADVVLGKQTATALPIQLIQDDPAAALSAPSNCSDAANGAILSSASSLGSNGILGIGSVKLDCGQICLTGDYSTSYVQYYSCPVDAVNSGDCRPAAVPSNFQVFNPIAAFPEHNNGVVLVLPAVSGLGAPKVNGELIFGINTNSNNALPPTSARIQLGVDWQNHFASYLSVSTSYKGKQISNSYLDTGTNALFFADPEIPNCQQSTWFCPATTLHLSAIISDGDHPANNKAIVNFDIGNSEVFFSTTNTAFPFLGGTYQSTISGAPSFSWGLPFFYGRRTYMSIWQQSGAENGPWYAF